MSHTASVWILGWPPPTYFKILTVAELVALLMVVAREDSASNPVGLAVAAEVAAAEEEEAAAAAVITSSFTLYTNILSSTEQDDGWLCFRQPIRVRAEAFSQWHIVPEKPSMMLQCSYSKIAVPNCDPSCCLRV